MSLLIISACNERYEKFMMPLVRSVLRNTPHEIRVDFLNPKGSIEEQADYCANYRIAMVDGLLSARNLLWLDADSLVRYPLEILDLHLNAFDTLSVFTPEMGGPGSCNRWLISTVGVSASKGGHNFVRAWRKEYEEIKAQWYPSIMTCQQAYVNVVERGKFKVKDVGYDYSDKNMGQFSPIWEAQGPRKHEDPAWLAEIAKYAQPQDFLG